MFNIYRSTIRNNEITYSQFINLLENGQVSKVVMSKNYLEITPCNTKVYNDKILFTANLNDATLVPMLEECKVEFYGRSENDKSFINVMFPTIVSIAAIWFCLRFIAISTEKNKLLTEIRDLLKEKQ